MTNGTFTTGNSSSSSVATARKWLPDETCDMCRRRTASDDGYPCDGCKTFFCRNCASGKDKDGLDDNGRPHTPQKTALFDFCDGRICGSCLKSRKVSLGCVQCTDKVLWKWTQDAWRELEAWRCRPFSSNHPAAAVGTTAVVAGANVWLETTCFDDYAASYLPSFSAVAECGSCFGPICPQCTGTDQRDPSWTPALSPPRTPQTPNAWDNVDPIRDNASGQWTCGRCQFLKQQEQQEQQQEQAEEDQQQQRQQRDDGVLGKRVRRCGVVIGEEGETPEFVGARRKARRKAFKPIEPTIEPTIESNQRLNQQSNRRSGFK